MSSCKLHAPKWAFLMYGMRFATNPCLEGARKVENAIECKCNSWLAYLRHCIAFVLLLLAGRLPHVPQHLHRVLMWKVGSSNR